MFHCEFRVAAFLAICCCLWSVDQLLCVSSFSTVAQTGVEASVSLQQPDSQSLCVERENCQVTAGKLQVFTGFFQLVRLMFLFFKDSIKSTWFWIVLIIGGIIFTAGAFSE